MGNGCIRQSAVEVSSPTLPTFKVVVVGESKSGKTSIVRRFVENKFDLEYKETTDVDITSVVKKVNVPKHAIVSLELWDIPGLNDMDLRKTFYLDVDAVVVVADISSPESLSLAGSWNLDVANNARVSRTFTETVPNPDGKTYSKKIRKEYVRPKVGSVPILLLGNKYDVAKENFMKEVESQEVRAPLPDIIPNGNVVNRKNEENEVILDKQLSDSADDFKNVIQKDDSANNVVENDDSSNPVIKNDDLANIVNDSAQNGDEIQVAVEDSDSPMKKKKTVENGTTGNEVPEKTPLENGDVTPENGKVKMNGILGGIQENSTETAPKYKKIFPKDEINGRIVTNTEDVKKSPPLPEDVKSLVTYATSVTSLLPPCVEEIERIAEKYEFLAGVPVSAKTVNGGVQEAIQSLLRHLVAKKLFNLDVKVTISERKNKFPDMLSTKSSRSGVSKMSRSRKRNNVNFEPLQEVGIIEIDEVIRRCNPTLRDAEELTTGYYEALHTFKMTCFKNKITSGTRVSLEVCISALKEGLTLATSEPVTSDPRENIRLMLLSPEKQIEKQPVVSLIVEEKDGFPNIRIVDGNRDDVESFADQHTHPSENYPQIPSHIEEILKEYREKFLLKSIEVMKHGSEIEAVLGKRTAQLVAKEEKAWETAVAAGLSHAEVRRILSALAQDKARLRGTVEHVRETRKTVQTAAGKIRATLLF